MAERGAERGMIRFIDVFKEYDNGTKALKGVNVRIDDGEFVFLVGPSGSGKSVMERMSTSATSSRSVTCRMRSAVRLASSLASHRLSAHAWTANSGRLTNGVSLPPVRSTVRYLPGDVLDAVAGRFNVALTGRNTGLVLSQSTMSFSAFITRPRPL